MVLEINGYRVSDLVKDQEAVEASLTRLGGLLADAREYMQHIGRLDLADRLEHLGRHLDIHRDGVDDEFDREFRDVTGAAADACMTGGPDEAGDGAHDPAAEIYRALAWSIVDLVVIRIGGHGTIHHPGNRRQES